MIYQYSDLHLFRKKVAAWKKGYPFQPETIGQRFLEALEEKIRALQGVRAQEHTNRCMPDHLHEKMSRLHLAIAGFETILGFDPSFMEISLSGEKTE